jgi:hypothetical protein
VIKNILAICVAALGLISAPAIFAKTPQAILDAMRDRASKAGFDGSILIGEPDGSYVIITTGKIL